MSKVKRFDKVKEERVQEYVLVIIIWDKGKGLRVEMVDSFDKWAAANDRRVILGNLSCRFAHVVMKKENWETL